VNGAHDVGGMHGHGPVTVEHDEPVFHCAWERRMFALSIACGAHGRWNIDIVRSAREQMLPGDYLTTTYYEHWLFGFLRLLVKHGFASPDEIARAERGELAPGQQAPIQDGALRAEGVPRMLGNRRVARLDDPVPPVFRVGQAVVARNLHPTGHTRTPRYVRGRRGEVAIDHGVFLFPDTHAAGKGPKPQHVYSVRFAARELWGPDASPRDSVYVDLWDDYLEAAP